jgi:predicted kinase
VDSFTAENAELFEQRVTGGFVRECDGDIHLENICLSNDTVYIFDCIEFNERFRCCDTAADIAFLLMDLDFHERHDLAGSVINNYISFSGDEGIAGLINFYKVYRAFVRGKVESFRSTDSGIEPDKREQAKIRATRYFCLARGYIERQRLQRTLFITCGLMGSGKSTLAGQIAFELGIVSLSSDFIRKELTGRTLKAPIREEFGEGIYDRETTLQTYSELLRRVEVELENGHSAIVDASFMHCNQRILFSTLAQAHLFRFVILHISCSMAENRRRLIERESTGKSISDGRLELLAYQTAGFEPPTESEGTVIILPANLSPETMTGNLYERLL